MNREKTIYDMNLLDRFLFAEAAKDTEFMELVLSIILNTHGTEKAGVTDELIELLQYFENTGSRNQFSESERIRSIQKKVDCIRSEEKMGEGIIFEWEKRQQDKLEGRLEGKLEGRLEDAKAFVEKGIPIETISECTGLTEDQIKQACNMAK